MTVRLFRGLIVASLLLGVAGGIADWVFPPPLPTSLAEAQDSLPLPAPMASAWGWLLTGGFGALLLVAGVVATVALWMVRRWGRTASLWLTILVIPVSVWAGPSVLSGVGWALYEASLMLWGAVLAAAYWSPLAPRFDRA